MYVLETAVWAPPVCTPHDTVSCITPDNLLAASMGIVGPFRHGRHLAIAVSCVNYSQAGTDSWMANTGGAACVKQDYV